MKKLSIALLLAAFVVSCGSQKKPEQQTIDITQLKSVDEIQYPYDFTYDGNPLVRHIGAADPDVHVWDGVVWMYTSQDRTVDSLIHPHHYAAMDGYHVFSSTDMINWTDHGEILHSSDIEWGWEDGGYMWAPGAARKDGKYYLYFPHRDKESNWRIGVAIADSPAGPFKDSGRPMEGLTGIDPMILKDDDGEYYLYNNPGIVAKLKPNMIELAEEVHMIDYGPEEVMENDTLQFNEGAYMHKKDGVYYFSYTNWKNQTHQGYYATGDNPYGPFEWQGAMAPNPQGAQDHHSIIEFKDQWYYFYHIAIPNLPVFKESQGRIACYDKLYYKEDGTIKMVEHTRNY
ncbi:MAG: family 43 glycosylhydrolase [Bacteroidales bacterium]